MFGSSAMNNEDRDPEADCLRAIAIGRAALTKAAEGGPAALGVDDPSSYLLVSAKLVTLTRRRGSWRLTFKPRDLLPETEDDRLGAGGEIFVHVDLATGST